MTKQEYREQAAETVKRLIDRHAAAVQLFNETHNNGETDNATYFRKKMEQYKNEILEYI